MCDGKHTNYDIRSSRLAITYEAIIHFHYISTFKYRDAIVVL